MTLNFLKANAPQRSTTLQYQFNPTGWRFRMPDQNTKLMDQYAKEPCSIIKKHYQLSIINVFWFSTETKANNWELGLQIVQHSHGRTSGQLALHLYIQRTPSV